MEQRSWGIEYALEALGDHPLLKSIQSELKELHYDGHAPLIPGYILESDPSSVFKLPVDGGAISIQFDVTTGAIIHFTDSRVSSESLASPGNPYGQIVYQTFDDKSYTKFLTEYL